MIPLIFNYNCQKEKFSKDVWSQYANVELKVTKTKISLIIFVKKESQFIGAKLQINIQANNNRPRLCLLKNEETKTPGFKIDENEYLLKNAKWNH